MKEKGNPKIRTKVNRKLANIGNMIIVGGTIQDEPRFITARTMDSIRESKQQVSVDNIK